MNPAPAQEEKGGILVWDAEGRVVDVTRADNTVVYFAYDARGRRISKQTGNGAMSAYVYDGWNMVGEYSIANGTTTLVMSFTWGLDLSGTLQGAGGVGGLLAVRRHTGQSWPGTYYPAYDGNITEYLNFSDYGLRLTYDAFGNTIAKAGSFSGQPTASLPFRFSTKCLDEETCLYYYGYRYYDPVTGRWPSRDPIGEYVGINLYGFVGNSAIDRVDILGLSWPHGCAEVCNKLKYLEDLINHLNKRIGRFLGVQNPDSHWTTIKDQCKVADRVLNFIDKCCCEPASNDVTRKRLKEKLVKTRGRCNRALARAREYGLEPQSDSEMEKGIAEIRRQIEQQRITGLIEIEAKRLRYTAELAEKLRNMGIVVVSYPIIRGGVVIGWRQISTFPNVISLPLVPAY